ncbi:MAG TPA: tetratricopeptide repeat protein [Nitrospirota bacterium]|nr:tetratricopeptide repeat protein [Nitrospirota bacterium]
MESLRTKLEKTLQYYEKKDYVNAEKGVDEMLAGNPDFPRALFLKAVILDETGRTDEAEDYYRKSGSTSLLWLRLALQLQETDPERALRYFNKVKEVDPENNLIWFNMGKIYEKAGRSDEARKCYSNISMMKEVVSKLVSPLGFLIIMIAGSIAMFNRGDLGLGSLVVVSGIICLAWLKRDGGRVIQMLQKKKKYAS